MASIGQNIAEKIAPQPAGEFVAGDPAADFQPPFTVLRPVVPALPVVVNSPHSGRHYPKAFLAASRLDPLTIRQSEDSFVDEIFACAPVAGAPLMHAHFPRVYLDVNREPYELDPEMFDSMLPSYINSQSLRVAAGLGTIARMVNEERDIYRQPLTFAEAERRINTLYWPYHAQLESLLKETRDRFGCALLLDCHSMPSGHISIDEDYDGLRPDIVLGDRYGSSCTPTVIEAVETILRRQGYRVARNHPYAGGFNTEKYGQPRAGSHALQIEIGRALYMDEQNYTRSDGLARLQAHMAELLTELRGFDFTACRT
jgi:N-formylglutamate amidohydrolase